ncbi:hypothetical protein JAAARDRAFT_200049 [Jaapia argillacea MUCL 33604]|uniref:Uncharacterized protein n=1 Tax=Jaapia argillacea MUCL 33604 TaxID=933084 RepID=A0A067PH94_9AGAM|nr:hypothetical protein JAAARDRAFT_200049 [Jaapia argillacea MUCL 33604]
MAAESPTPSDSTVAGTPSSYPFPSFTQIEPTPTPSNSSEQSSPINYHNSQQYLYGFIVTFLALFLAFVGCGFSSRRAMDMRRRAVARAAGIEVDGNGTMGGGGWGAGGVNGAFGIGGGRMFRGVGVGGIQEMKKPVWVEVSVDFRRRDEEKQLGRWESMKPLSMAILRGAPSPQPFSKKPRPSTSLSISLPSSPTSPTFDAMPSSSGENPHDPTNTPNMIANSSQPQSETSPPRRSRNLFPFLHLSPLHPSHPSYPGNRPPQSLPHPSSSPVPNPHPPSDSGSPVCAVCITTLISMPQARAISKRDGLDDCVIGVTELEVDAVAGSEAHWMDSPVRVDAG